MKNLYLIIRYWNFLEWVTSIYFSFALFYFRFNMYKKRKRSMRSHSVVRYTEVSCLVRIGTCVYSFCLKTPFGRIHTCLSGINATGIDAVSWCHRKLELTMRLHPRKAGLTARPLMWVIPVVSESSRSLSHLLMSFLFSSVSLWSCAAVFQVHILTTRYSPVAAAPSLHTSTA